MGDQPEPPVSAAETRAIAYRYLGRREYGCRELSQKLQRRGVDTATAQSVTADLAAEGLVSDSRFTGVFVRSRISRLVGPLKIRAQLRQKGIDDALIEEALAGHAGTWEESAYSWVEKRAMGNLDRKEKARIYRSGMNRGFTHEHMMRALDRYPSAS